MHPDVYELISFEFGMAIDTSKMYCAILTE